MNSKFQAMINALRDLLSEVASKLLNRRLTRQDDAADPTAGVPIKDRMHARIAELAEEPAETSEAPDKDAPIRAASSSHPLRGSTAKKKAPWQAVSGMFSALAHRFSLHRGHAKLEPFMAEKMRRSAFDHVNQALILAKKGDAEGARIHAELANSAMETAADYMSDEELNQLRKMIEERLGPTKS